MPYTDTSLKLDDIPVGKSRCLEFDDLQVGLFRNADGFFAVANTCPHRGGPLDQGMVSEGVVSCPWHQWQFQLGDGVCRSNPAIRIPTYAVEVRDGAIWIDLGKPPEKKA
ncbi:MAG: nitrite reductase small subunit NirD [Methylacidiphilales bacterium]|nr:nitrite reductase small subunit NirD [Candidatus Methylacidiphilales bacterium]